MASDAFFLDTSAWIITLNRREDLHARALRVWRELALANRPVVFTDLVVAETGNGLARSPARTQFADSVRLILSSPRAQLVSTDRPSLDAGLRLYEQRPDKGGLSRLRQLQPDESGGHH